MDSKSRIGEYDGLRGLASFSVVLSHFACTFFPAAMFGASSGESAGVQDWLSRSVFFGLYGGAFAVFVFYVLSGYVLSAAYFGRDGGQTALVTTVTRRYLRLTIPMVASALFAWALLQAWPNPTGDYARATGNVWLARFYSDEISLRKALIDAVFDPYRFGWSSINMPLWTMQFELLGSVCIFLIAKLVSRTRRLHALAILGVTLVAFGDRFLPLLAFLVGSLLFEFRHVRDLGRGLASLMIFGGLALGSLPTQPRAGTWVELITATLPAFIARDAALYSIAAGLLVFGATHHSVTRNLLGRKALSYLGRISFALFLLHWPLLATVGIHFHQLIPLGQAASWIVFPIYIAVLVLLAHGLTVLIDEPLVAYLKRSQALRPSNAWDFIVCTILFVGWMVIAWRMQFDLYSVSVWALIACALYYLFRLSLRDALSNVQTVRGTGR